MQILKKTKKLLTNGEFLDILLESMPSSGKVRAKLTNFCCNSLNSDKSDKLKTELAKFGLKEFEIVNLINIRPKGLVHLQIIIEEMSERLSEDQMNKILTLFAQL